MSHAPRPPKEQRSFADRGDKSLADAAPADRRDLATDVQSTDTGDANVNLSEQGRFGNLKQNLNTQHKSGDR